MGDWLQSLVPWGTQAILWVQSFRTGALDILFLLATFLGEELFLIMLFSAIYWCLDKSVGIALCYLVTLSNYVNSWAKLLYRIPRPAHPNIAVLRDESSPSFPSGHAQNSVVLWGYLATRIRRPAAWLAAAIIVLLVASSRVYLGIHFPQDLVGGLLIGVLLLILFVWLVRPIIVPWVRRQRWIILVAFSMAIPLLMMFIHPTDYQGRWPAKDAVMVCGVVAGASIGFLIESRFIRFQVAGAWWRRVVRLIVGAVLIALFYAIPSVLLPRNIPPGAEIAARFIRYGLLAFVLAAGAPWLFIRLGLAGRQPA